MPPTAPIASFTRLARLLACALAGLASVTVAPIHAQPDGGSGLSANAAAWRATSRLGYAPTPASAQAAVASPRAWALQQVDASYAASRRPPNIPAEVVRFNAPLNDIARDFHTEREARRTRREPPAAVATGPAMLPMAGGEEAFSREMAQSAAAWRLMACSDPALENPLLARMTEFWFNHLNVFVGKGAVRPFVGHYVVNVIRPHALGRFEDLLLASARHPAMLLYLDQIGRAHV